MAHAREEVVHYTEVTEVRYTGVTGGSPPPPPLPPPRRPVIRILVRASIGVSVVIGGLALLFWLIYRPQTIRVAVATATLARFDFDTTPIRSTLSYNLTAVLSVSNPNKRVSVYYDQLEAAALYQGERFGRDVLPVSFQGTRRTDAAPAVFAGTSPVILNVGKFGEDSKTGVFPVDLWVDGVVRYKYGELTTTSGSTLTVKCHLALKLMVASGWVDCTVTDS